MLHRWRSRHRRLQSAHFCPQTTQELPKKHHETGTRKKLPTDALSQIDYEHTRHYEDSKEVRLCQQRAFWKIYVGVCACWVEDKPPTCFKTLRRFCVIPYIQNNLFHVTRINLWLTELKTFNTKLIDRFRRTEIPLRHSFWLMTDALEIHWFWIENPEKLHAHFNFRLGKLTILIIHLYMLLRQSSNFRNFNCQIHISQDTVVNTRFKETAD